MGKIAFDFRNIIIAKSCVKYKEFSVITIKVTIILTSISTNATSFYITQSAYGYN